MQSPPHSEQPQVTTVLSLRSATKAPLEATIVFTSRSSFLTEVLSPPYLEEPHVTTRPSLRSAAKAQLVATIVFTSRSSQMFDDEPQHEAVEIRQGHGAEAM